MARLEHYFTKFEKDNYYHIYNRSVDRKPMFKNDGNYIYFLTRYKKYLSPVVDTYSYCLLINNFNFLIRVHDSKNLTAFNPKKSVHEIVSQQLRKFFQSYAFAFNKQQDRIGTLFQTPFKRALIDNPLHLTQMIYYIHVKPQAYCLVKNFRNWKWSSYDKILIENESVIKKIELLKLFESKQKYVNFHCEKQNLHSIERYILE